ncbi:hypothetical protein V8C44DRAFT_284643 [Trichoderma aethiopicum]
MLNFPLFCCLCSYSMGISVIVTLYIRRQTKMQSRARHAHAIVDGGNKKSTRNSSVTSPGDKRRKKKDNQSAMVYLLTFVVVMPTTYETCGVLAGCKEEGFVRFVRENREDGEEEIVVRRR